MMENQFNLIDEPWIPIADVGQVSLREVFTNPNYRGLGGNPIQKIAVIKLLLAIAQACSTPADDLAWRRLGTDGLAQKCLGYLDCWYDRFYLYGDKPFLQLPAIAVAEIKSFGVLLPEVATGNTTVLSQFQMERQLDDAEKAMLVTTLMAFALGGKKTDNSIVLSPGYLGKRNAKGKPSSSVPGPAVERNGLLHNFVLGSSLRQTLWLNLLTLNQIERSRMFSEGIGTAPWERMPTGEACPVAEAMKHSLLGRLVPISRFCLLTDQGLHYSEGLAHKGYREGVADPSVAVNYSGKDPKALWVNPSKRPWRELTSLLGFLEQTSNHGFQSLYLQDGLSRARSDTEVFGIWSGGLRVSTNAGEQYVSGSDDFVESVVTLHSASLGENWFARFKNEMTAMDDLAKTLYGRVLAYCKDQKIENTNLAERSSQLFWQLCERDFQQLVDCCEPDEASRLRLVQLRKKFAHYVHQAYDHYCPRETARQLDAWARRRPNNNKYLQQGI